MKYIQELSVLTLQLYVNIIISKIKELMTKEESPLWSRAARIRILAAPLTFPWHVGCVTVPRLRFFPCTIGIIVVFYLLELNIIPYNYTSTVSSISLAMLLLMFVAHK